MLDELSDGLSSPWPPGSDLAAVKVNGDEVTVDLHLPLEFLRHELDPYLSDAIVELVAMTLHPLGLHRIHVRAQDKARAFVPLSDFLSRPPRFIPEMPANADAVPDRLGPSTEQPGATPDYQGQPAAYGQGQPPGALSGKTVWLSAGHGWYWSQNQSRWTTQRGNNHGLVEDFSNAEAVNYYLARYLWNAGADVWFVRERAMTGHEVIVDNDEGAPAYQETGTWQTSSSPGYGQGTYRWTSTFDKRSATATWTPDLPEAGWYAVWAWYRHGANRTAQARYEIHHAGGVTTTSSSQEIHGQTWRYLGEYYFRAGRTGRVTLLNVSDDGGQAVIADAVRFGGGLGSEAEPGGASGKPRWEEAGKYWARYQGAPPELTEDDRTSRPLYAEWETAKGYPSDAENSVYISWHTNAGGGTGTNSYIHDTHPTAGSVELQDQIHAELVHDLRSGWNPDWVDRGQKRADFSEVRELSTIPGVLLEIAFHDTEDPGDADDLREPVFRQIAARAVFQGVVKYFAERDAQSARLLPEPPVRLVARSSGAGQVTLTWAQPPCCDGLVGEAATSYKVYQSLDGTAFDNGTAATSPTLTLTNIPSGVLRFFRVTALNEGGESFPTPVVALRTPPAGEKPSFLIVDGFDRLDQSALIPQWESSSLGTDRRMFLERMNRYDYAVKHGEGLSACGRSFDGAVNEAVEQGDVILGDYPAVDWFTGEDSTSGAALSDTERRLLASYLDAGGSLMVSGSEIGYDLVEAGRDAEFYAQYLRAAYLGDDAGTYAFEGLPGGPFAGLAGTVDDGSGDTYHVDYPDRLAAVPGSAEVLRYGIDQGAAAAVAHSARFQTLYFGFPLETVTDPETRSALFCASADYLLGPGETSGPSEFRALWVDAYHNGIKTKQQIDTLIETAQAGGFNALFAQVRRRGDTYYPSALDPWAPDADRGFDALAYLIEQAHAVGIEVHAWATTLAIWNGNTAPSALNHAFNQHGPGAAGRDYWLMTSADGRDRTDDGTVYLDPSHPDVVEYTVAVYSELAAQYDLDGLHLDRVRYPWQNYGYNPTALARFQTQTERVDLPEADDAQWLQWRRDQLTALVRKVYLTTTAIKPRLRISAALSAAGGPPSASAPWQARTPYTHHLQDWPAWLEEGSLDLGLPMVYRDEDTAAASFDGWVEWARDHQGMRGTVVGTGLYLNSVQDSMSQWRRANQPSRSGNRVLGIAGYSYATPSDEGTSQLAFANVAATEVFTQPATTPAIPWKDFPTRGHLMGVLTPSLSCRPGLDGHPLTLTGPENRTLVADGGGWFGAVDLPPGQYLLTTEILTPSWLINVPVTVSSGTVAETQVLLPDCQHSVKRLYLPLIQKK
jgi:uncharacterized lipoprotein YddW (UPF0748 family)/N-acetylmuramoyl-L-alanine amidase